MFSTSLFGCQSLGLNVQYRVAGVNQETVVGFSFLFDPQLCELSLGMNPKCSIKSMVYKFQPYAPPPNCGKQDAFLKPGSVTSIPFLQKIKKN